MVCYIRPESAALTGGLLFNGGTGASAGGAGVWNSHIVSALSNTGMISGGNGGGATGARGVRGAGGVGVSNAGSWTVGSLSNSNGHMIFGGIGGSGGLSGGVGAAGVSNAGIITSLANNGTITGGGGGGGLHRSRSV
jgi:hypothetical protein